MIWALLLTLASLDARAGEACDRLRELPQSQRQALGPIVSVGASVSAGAYTRGPAQRLAAILGVPYHSHAVSGATSSVSRQALAQSRGACGTLIGVDMFFWDTVRGCANDPVGSLLATSRERQCRRVVLSNVPRLIPLQRSSCVASINAALDEARGIEVFPVVESLQSDPLSPTYFRPDRIHLTEAGALAATEKLCELLLPPDAVVGVSHDDSARQLSKDPARAPSAGAPGSARGE